MKNRITGCVLTQTHGFNNPQVLEESFLLLSQPSLSSANAWFECKEENLLKMFYFPLTPKPIYSVIARNTRLTVARNSHSVPCQMPPY